VCGGDAQAYKTAWLSVQSTQATLRRGLANRTSTRGPPLGLNISFVGYRRRRATLVPVRVSVGVWDGE